MLPPYNLGDFVMQQIEAHTKKIALALKTVGLINIQFAIKNDRVYIIEANPARFAYGALHLQSLPRTLRQLRYQGDAG